MLARPDPPVVSGGVPEMFKLCTEGHGLVRNSDRWQLDSLILEVFSNFGDSMILCQKKLLVITLCVTITQWCRSDQ